MAKSTDPTKTKKTKKAGSTKKKKRKADDMATTPKTKKTKKVKKEKSTDGKKKKKTKKVKTEDTEETPKKKKKKKASTDKKKKKTTEKKKKKKKVKAEPEMEVEEEAAEEAAPVKEEAAPAAEATTDAPAADGANPKCYVGNLSYDIDEDGIKAFFKDCGTITDVFWLEDKESGKFLGRGFITFENTDQARKAYAMKDQECLGRAIQVDYAKPRAAGNKAPREARPLSERPEGCTTVFVGNLSFDIDDDQMKEFAKPCGTVKSIRWLTHRDTGDFKGCGFIEFEESDAVDKFVKMNEQKLMGRPIRIDYAQTKSTGQRGGGGSGTKPMSEKPEGCTTVFVGNVSFDIEDDTIHNLAKEVGAGEVKNIRWLTDRETSEFKGCGFVEFYDTEAVDKFATANGKDVLGRNIRIDFAKPRAPREDKKW